MDYLLTTLTKKKEVDTIIRDTIDKLIKSVREVSKFATVALVDIESPDIQVYVKYFDVTLIPSTIFFFNAHHMKMDSGNPDHTKWVGSFHSKQDFIDVVEAIFRGAMKGKLIVNCPLPQDRTPKYQLLYKEM
ncbi:thioredoxin-like protein 4B isoform X2 [Tripterygium wilfordii]|uniref:thioredoxin-like protein 4B isoform X2 n=1 Tax=Tripterygium wilfordii TaxID=458696 RepID=UPI0018F7FC5B|nr:thioredoxin-like protein 4B isoform X2 [Tripterygium wilfordii]